jgi:hypothetical protein
MTTSIDIETAPSVRPRLVSPRGIRSARVYGVTALDMRSGYSIHYSDGMTEDYVGAVYHEGRGMWTAYRAVGTAGSHADLLVYPEVGHAWSFATKADATRALVKAQGITL